MADEKNFALSYGDLLTECEDLIKKQLSSSSSMDSPINMIVEVENIVAVLNFISGIALKHGVSEETVKNNHSRLKRLYFPEVSPELLDRVRPYLPVKNMRTVW